MDIAPNPCCECSHQIGLGGLLPQISNNRLHSCHDLVLVLRIVNVGNVTRVEQIVDIFEEGFTFNLSRWLKKKKRSSFLSQKMRLTCHGGNFCINTALNLSYKKQFL